MDQSGQGGHSRQNGKNFLCVCCVFFGVLFDSPKATPIPVLQSHEQQISG